MNRNASTLEKRLDRANSREFLFFLEAFAFYTAAVVVFFVIPLGRRWPDQLLGTWYWAPDDTVATAILEWGYRSLWSTGLHFFDWVAGYPLSNSLAGNETHLGWQILYSPLRVAGVGPVAAVNVMVCASFVISGIGGVLFSRHLGLGRAGSLCAGAVLLSCLRTSTIRSNSNH
jgi:hypothetical protein